MSDDTFTALAKAPGDFDHVLEPGPPGRPIRAEGWLRPSARAPHRRPKFMNGMPDFQAGHLIPARFGGSGAAKNLVPMSTMMNKSYVASVENAIARLLDTGPVYLRVTVAYDGPGPVPSWVRHECFQPTADGVLRRAPGGDVLNAVAAAPGVKMSQLFDPRTGESISAREWLDPESRRGLGPSGAH